MSKFRIKIPSRCVEFLSDGQQVTPSCERKICCSESCHEFTFFPRMITHNLIFMFFWSYIIENFEHDWSLSFIYFKEGDFSRRTFNQHLQNSMGHLKTTRQQDLDSNHFRDLNFCRWRCIIIFMSPLFFHSFMYQILLIFEQYFFLKLHRKSSSSFNYICLNIAKSMIKHIYL